MVDGGEEFFDIAFQYPAGSGVVFADFKGNRTKPIQRFVDIPRFGVGNIKGLIAAVFIGMMNQVLMQRYYIVHQVKGKFLNVFFFLFPFKNSFQASSKLSKLTISSKL